ncbi:MAG: Hsp33 family molecular chaperone HslO [Kurthia sp.]|nr:Hsp33 family molecular chaperone HslO [Candidatus Kurthia equi]
MNDYLVKAAAYNYQVRAFAVVMTDTIEEVRRRHDLLPIAATAIGRAMTATVLMSTMLKGNDQISVTINGGGPVGSLLIDANTTGDVRGYVTNPKAYVDLNDDNQLDIGTAVGPYGSLSVTRRNGNNMPFIGQVPLVSGEIGDDFTSYLLTSEQIPSSVGVSTLIAQDFSVSQAGGFIIQLMPGTDVKIIEEIEAHIAENISLTNMLQQQKTPLEILQGILGEDLDFLEEMPVQFKCECSRERIANAIISLGRVEIEDMIEVDGQANAECHFCNENYLFTKDDLKQLLAQAK